MAWWVIVLIVWGIINLVAIFKREIVLWPLCLLGERREVPATFLLLVMLFFSPVYIIDAIMLLFQKQ